MTWDDITEYYNGATGESVSKDTVRKGAFLLQKFKGSQFFRPDAECDSSNTIQVGDRPSIMRELQKERMKLQTEKLEYNRSLREDARDELLIEKLISSLDTLSPIAPPARLNRTAVQRAGAVFWGDEHIGSEFEIKGLYGEVLNVYNVEIAEQRMWELLDQIVSIADKEGLTSLSLFNMGDFTDGILRVGQLAKLQMGAVDSTAWYMEFIAQWLNELSKHIYVRFQMVHGNHSECRLLGQPKGTFKDENMGKIVSAYIKVRLADNPNFEYVENPSGLIFDTIVGYNLLGIHGEVKNMERAIRDFSATYKTQIDFLVAGHLHHASSEVVGVNQEVIRVPSVVGVDPFSMTLNKTSNAGATFVILEEGHGKTVEYSIKLN